MKETIFWDVDTQYDFMMPDGKLYVPGAETIIDKLQTITQFAREHGIRIMGSVDYHSLHDEEISDSPDFQSTYPPHCLAHEPGSEKIQATLPQNPLWIESKPLPVQELKQLIQNHNGEIYFRKQHFDVFTNPNVKPALDMIRPGKIIVFGVALDVCDAYAIEGFLMLNKYHIYLVTDAVKPLNEENGRKLMNKWKGQGVKLLTTADLLEWNL